MPKKVMLLTIELNCDFMNNIVRGSVRKYRFKSPRCLVCENSDVFGSRLTHEQIISALHTGSQWSNLYCHNIISLYNSLIYLHTVLTTDKSSF